MAFGNYYIIIKCTHCNWNTTHYQQSDLIVDKRDLPPDSCPKCGSKNLQSSKPILGKVNLLTNLLASKIEQLKNN